MHLNYHSSVSAPLPFSCLPPCVFPSPLIPFAPPPFLSSPSHLCDQTANLRGFYFLLICRAPLLPISTSERLLLMVPKEGNQPWIHTRPLPAFRRCDGHWEGNILFFSSSPTVLNGNISISFVCHFLAGTFWMVNHTHTHYSLILKGFLK